MAGKGGKRSTSWVKGQSGNLAGYPKRTPEERNALDLAKQFTPEAITALRDIAVDKKAVAAARVTAAEAILNRVYGKPKEISEATIKHERRTEPEIMAELAALGLVARGDAGEGAADPPGGKKLH